MSRDVLLETFRSHGPAIAPSMLKCDFGNLHREVELLEAAGADALHLDVMDGHFVPNLSYGPLLIRRLRDLTSLPFDAHLMIAEPARYLDDFLDAGCDGVTFHVEAVSNPLPLLRRIRNSGAAAGLALNPGTPVESVEPALGECDLVLVMSVEPGFGGQEFIPASLEKLKYLAGLRSRAAAGPVLSIDGGVGPSTISRAASAGADVFVVGSAVFDSEDYSTAINELRSVVSRQLKSILIP